MNRTWHIVKKDFTRLRLPLLLWTGLALGGVILSERMFSANSVEHAWFSRQAGILGATTFLGMIVCYILAAALALEDPLVGTRMFWATRPISGGRLLAAKLLGAALFFLVWPVLVGLPWWLWCGFGIRAIGNAAWQVVALQALLVLPAVALAALAGQSGRFMLWTLATILAVAAGTGMVAYYLPKGLPRELIESRIMLALAVGAVTTGAIIWLQYRSRRLDRSIILTASGAALALLIGSFWPWNLAGLWPKDTRQVPGTEKISLTFGDATQEAKDGRNWVTLRFTAKDIPVELGILSGEARVEFRWPDGTTLKRRGKVAPANPDYTARHLLKLPPAQIDLATERKRKEMAGVIRQRMIERGLPPPSPLPEGTSLVTYVDIPLELTARFATAPAVRVALRLETGRAELLVEVPLKEGAGRTANGVRLQVLELEPVKPASADKPATQMAATVITSQPTRMQLVHFLLVDRAHGAVTMEGASFIPSFRASILQVGINRTQLRLNIPQLWRDDTWVGAPEWLEQGTLAAVTYRPNGGFDRELRADQLEFVNK